MCRLGCVRQTFSQHGGRSATGDLARDPSGNLVSHGRRKRVSSISRSQETRVHWEAVVAMCLQNFSSKCKEAVQFRICLQNFSIGEDKLISLAKQVFKTDSGQKDASVLSDNFRFEFPIVSLGKKVIPHDAIQVCTVSAVYRQQK